MGKISIIIQREFNERVRKKSFIITTILMPILMVAFVGIVAWVSISSTSSKTRELAVIDNSGVIANRLESSQTLFFIPTDKSFEQIKQQRDTDEFGNIAGILVIGADVMTNTTNVQLYTYGTSTMDMESAITRQIRDIIEADKLKGYDIENLPQILQEIKSPVSLVSYRIEESGEEKESSSGLAMGLAYVFGFLIYMFVFIYGAMVMQGVIEEKSSKVIEVMVSSVKPFQLMMGKIIGIAMVALTQFLIWAVFLVILAFVGTQFIPADVSAEAATALADGSMGDMAAASGMDPQAFALIKNLTDPMFILMNVAGFIIFFIGGYLLYAAMFAAIGSAVSNEQDAQQLQLPISMPLILALVIMMGAMREPDSAIAFWGSMIPFTSPIIMLARLPYGVPAWELALSIALLFGTFFLVVWMAGKIYRVGIFMHGKKPTFKELIKWSRYKY